MFAWSRCCQILFGRLPRKPYLSCQMFISSFIMKQKSLQSFKTNLFPFSIKFVSIGGISPSEKSEIKEIKSMMRQRPLELGNNRRSPFSEGLHEHSIGKRKERPKFTPNGKRITQSLIKKICCLSFLKQVKKISF